MKYRPLPAIFSLAVPKRGMRKLLIFHIKKYLSPSLKIVNIILRNRNKPFLLFSITVQKCNLLLIFLNIFDFYMNNSFQAVKYNS